MSSIPLAPETSLDELLLTHALAAIGTCLYVVRAAPATVQLARGGRVEAAMARTFVLLVLTGLWWIAYAIEIGNVPTLVASALSVAAPAYGLFLLRRDRQVARGVAVVLAAGVVVALLEAELTPLALGVTAAVGSAGLTLPETAKTLREPEDNAVDISLATWILMAVNAAVWLVYGVLIGHPLLGAAGIVQLPCSVIVLRRAVRARRVGAGAAGSPRPRLVYAGEGAPGRAAAGASTRREDEEAA